MLHRAWAEPNLVVARHADETVTPRLLFVRDVGQNRTVCLRVHRCVKVDTPQETGERDEERRFRNMTALAESSAPPKCVAVGVLSVL